MLPRPTVCGHGPSGRNGGFCETLWTHLPSLRERFGADAALEVARASTDERARRSARGARRRASTRGSAARGYVMASTAPAHDAVLRRARGVRAAGRATGSRARRGAVRARCDSPRFRARALVPDDATVQPARLALGLRERVLERGVAIYERSRVRRAAARRPARRRRRDRAAGACARGARRARRQRRHARRSPLRARARVTSSHIVLTEPVPDVLEAIGWTGGECVTDARTFVHYFRTTRDGRIAFGWGGGRLAPGARLGGRVEVDPDVAGATRDRTSWTCSRALAGRAITHAWGGPIDVSPSHLPQIGTLDGAPVHYAFGFTGNGVGPSHMGAGGADFFAQLVAAAIRQTQVQQHQVEGLALEQVARLLQAVSQTDLETVLLERVFHPHGNGGIVFDEKDSRHGKIPGIRDWVKSLSAPDERLMTPIR